MAPNSRQPREKARAHLLTGAELRRQTVDACMDPILAGAELIADVFRAGGKLLLCGNGGSAADCQHMAAEFVGRLTKDVDRPGLPAIALTTDTSFLTAYANDNSFDGVFERQVLGLGKPGDLLIAISTSGNSANVIRAVEAARTARMSTLALTGTGGALAGLADVAISVPSEETGQIQELHLAIEHVLCELAEAALFGDGPQGGSTA